MTQIGSQNERDLRCFTSGSEDKRARVRDETCQRSLETDGKETDSALEPLKRTQACQHLDFSLRKVVLDFCLPELYGN